MAAAASSSQQQQRRPTRNDPSPRPADGASDGTRLLNKDPNKHYVFVATSPNYVIGEYEDRGYQVEVLEEGGVSLSRSRRGSKVGEEIRYRDMVLMSCSKERKAELDQFGEFGNTGWAKADRIEEKIIDKRSAQADLMRGIRGARGYVGVSHEVGPLVPDTGNGGGSFIE